MYASYEAGAAPTGRHPPPSCIYADYTQLRPAASQESQPPGVTLGGEQDDQSRALLPSNQGINADPCVGRRPGPHIRVENTARPPSSACRAREARTGRGRHRESTNRPNNARYFTPTPSNPPWSTPRPRSPIWALVVYSV
jgi:hypothetical protein